MTDPKEPPLPSLHPGDRLPPTNEQIEKAEETAANEALMVFAKSLQRELDALRAGGDVLAALATKTHEHFLVWADTPVRRGCLIYFTINFSWKGG